MEDMHYTLKKERMLPKILMIKLILDAEFSSPGNVTSEREIQTYKPGL